MLNYYVANLCHIATTNYQLTHRCLVGLQTFQMLQLAFLGYVMLF